MHTKSNRTRQQNFPLAYEHPSTIVLVDDDENFLRAMELNVPNGLLYRSFTDPGAALAYLNGFEAASRSLIHRAISYYTDYGHDALIHVDMGLFEDNIMEPDRFALPAVLITDYSMPRMDGLDLCIRVNDPSVKKILLTGFADESTGIAAFNEGIIDRFVLKGSPDAAQATFEHAVALQSAYFSDLQNPLLSAAKGISEFFRDAETVACVLELKKRQEYVEHYLTKDPFGYYMATRDGRLARLAIYDATDMALQLEAAIARGAPGKVIDRLTKRSHAMIFYETPLAEQLDDFPWLEYLFPCRSVVGNQGWWLALDRNAPPPLDYEPRVHALSAVRAG